MSEAAVAESVTIAAVPERMGLARAFVAGVLGGSHPCNDVAVLLASELVTNSVRHSGSAVPGGLVTVAVAVGAGGVRVEVTDRSGDGAPALPPAVFADNDAEGRRGWGSWMPAPHDGLPAGDGFTTTWVRACAGLSHTDLGLAYTSHVPRMYLALTAGPAGLVVSASHLVAAVNPSMPSSSWLPRGWRSTSRSSRADKVAERQRTAVRLRGPLLAHARRAAGQSFRNGTVWTAPGPEWCRRSSHHLALGAGLVLV